MHSTVVAPTKKVFIYEPSSPEQHASTKKGDEKTTPSKPTTSTYKEILKKLGPNGTRKPSQFVSPPKQKVTILGPYSTIQHIKSESMMEHSLSQPTPQQIATKELIDLRVEEHRRDLMEQKLGKKGKESSLPPVAELPTLEQSPSPFVSGIPPRKSLLAKKEVALVQQQQEGTISPEESVIIEEEQLSRNTSREENEEEETDKVDVMKLKQRLSSYLKENLKPIPILQESTRESISTTTSETIPPFIPSTHSSGVISTTTTTTTTTPSLSSSSSLKVKQSIDLYNVNDNFQELQHEIESYSKNLTKRLEELKKFEQEFTTVASPEEVITKPVIHISPPITKPISNTTTLTPTLSQKEKRLLECKKLLEDSDTPTKKAVSSLLSSQQQQSIVIPPLPMDFLSKPTARESVDARQSIISLSQFSPIRPLSQQVKPTISLEAPFSPIPSRSNFSNTPTELAAFSSLSKPRPAPVSPQYIEQQDFATRRSSTVSISTVAPFLHSSYLLQQQ